VRVQAPARLLPVRKKYRVMLPFMAEAFQAGDKLVHIIDKNDGDERRARLTQASIDVETAKQIGPTRSPAPGARTSSLATLTSAPDACQSGQASCPR
jgi:hypothetical protein